jgi:hypothetical protein
VAVTAASLLTGVYNDEPRNRHAIFASDIFLVSSMMTLVDLITKDYSARGFFRMHQNAQHFILNSDTAYPMMNKDMLSKSDLRKLTGNLLDPQACLKVMIMWIQRIYSFHTVALIDQVNTWVDPSRLRDILFKLGGFHEWATKIIPDVIFAPPRPANAEHIWERKERQLELEHQSLQSLDNEIDLTSLQEVDGGHGEPEENIIRVTQGQRSTILEAETPHGSIQVVTAELISNEQANEITAQAEAPGDYEAAMERHGIEEALNQAQEAGEALVLAGMHGAPATVAGFRVTEYIERDVPDNSPIEAYPPGEGEDPYMKAVISYIDTNYPERRKLIVPRLDRMEKSQLIKLATIPGKLEMIIQMMELRKYTPEPKLQIRCVGKYKVPPNDPALSLLEGMEYTALVQIQIAEGKDYASLIKELTSFVGIFSPEHKLEVSKVVPVMPNLTEQEILEDQDAKTIRVRFKNSFYINSFLDISENDSIIKQEWNKLADENFHSMQLLAQRPVNLVPIAIFPQILPEHGIQQVKERLSSMSAVWESNEQMAVDWCNEIHTSNVNFATLFAPSTRTSLSRIVRETELDLTFGRFRGIRIQEVVQGFIARR